MENKKVLLGLALTGMMMASGCSASSKTSEKQTDKTSTELAVVGECHGINSCKGTGACGGKGHSCAGKNSCKGKGWLKLSKGECQEKGGEFKAEAM